ncbi:MAG: diaminopimelate epimerase [Tannerellaceae bacterium]|jgi:diaminopimelate epimerase|nr:diaminopimelate epimerase [Tannerellaceae bacterium]
MGKMIPFTKMHGAGNDYIYVDTTGGALENPAALAVAWSDRHKGIGADGLVLIGRSDKADFSMRIFNADGSEALMCGNASRCIAKYVYDKGLTKKTTITLDTLSGVKELRMAIENGLVSEVTVDMGAPAVGNLNFSLDAAGRIWTGAIVSMGNPHFVVFTDDLHSVDLSAVGPELENHYTFMPERTNVEFVEICSRDEMRMRVWERGSGITLACGTGACASVVAAAATGRTDAAARVLMDGGMVSIRWDKTVGRVFKTGPAVTVFEGEILIN